jgi:uncharacterized protein
MKFDPAKNAANLAKHGLALSDFLGFDDEPGPVVINDDRFDYGEVRRRIFGRIDGKAHMVVVAESKAGLRLISYRRAHDKELRRYGI